MAIESSCLTLEQFKYVHSHAKEYEGPILLDGNGVYWRVIDGLNSFPAITLKKIRTSDVMRHLAYEYERGLVDIANLGDRRPVRMRLVGNHELIPNYRETIFELTSAENRMGICISVGFFEENSSALSRENPTDTIEGWLKEFAICIDMARFNIQTNSTKLIHPTTWLEPYLAADIFKAAAVEMGLIPEMKAGYPERDKKVKE